MPPWIIVLIIIAVIVAFVFIYIVATYNSLVGLKNKVSDQWSQIDVELKRRFDLIPNFVSTVKGYAKHESETLEKVIAARNSYMNAENKEEAMNADNVLTSTLTKLFALTESYPDLKANENFLELQKELSETENKISYARKFYNDSAYQLNNKIDMFPSNIVAKMFNFKKVEFFKAQEAERENVKVEF